MSSPHHHVSIRSACLQIRVYIDNVTPEIEGGKYSIAKVVGEKVEVQADIFCDGHDLLRAQILFRHEDEKKFHTAQNQSRGFCIDQYPHNGDPLLALLNRKTLKVLVKRRYARSKSLAIMATWIKKLLFKHASPCPTRSSLFAMQHWA